MFGFGGSVISPSCLGAGEKEDLDEKTCILDSHLVHTQGKRTLTILFYPAPKSRSDIRTGSLVCAVGRISTRDQRDSDGFR